MAKVIAVIQEKGGTGKSTIATNLAGIAAGLLRVMIQPMPPPPEIVRRTVVNN